MDTKDKAMLYYLSIATDEKGSQCVGRNEIASLLSCSKPTAVNALGKLISEGHIAEKKMPFAVGRGHGFKMLYWITAKGKAFLLAHGTQGKECYDLLVASKFDAAVKEARRISNNGNAKKVSPKQKGLF